MTFPAGASELPDFLKLWDFQHPDSSEARFREILPQARESGDAGYTAELLTQIARAQGLQRKFDSAHATLDEVEGMLSAATPKARVRYLLERGRVFNSSGKPADAKPLFLSAMEAAQGAGLDPLAIDAAHMVAIVEPPDSSIVWNRRALEMAEASSDPKSKGWLGPLYNNLGWANHDRGDYEQALEIFRRAYEWRRSQEQPLETRIAKWSVARALRSLGRLDEALAMQRELVDEWKGAGGEDGYVSEEMGECLLALGRADEARPWFADAHRMLWADAWLAENEPARLARLAELGGVKK